MRIVLLCLLLASCIHTTVDGDDDAQPTVGQRFHCTADLMCGEELIVGEWVQCSKDHPSIHNFIVRECTEEMLARMCRPGSCNVRCVPLHQPCLILE